MPARSARIRAGAHASAMPFPGDFSPGADPSFPGPVCLVSFRGAAGPPVSADLANLFDIVNIAGTTGRTEDETEIWATWLIGAPALAPNMVMDADGDGEDGEKDLELMGFEVISQVREVDFVVNGFRAVSPPSALVML